MQLKYLYTGNLFTESFTSSTMSSLLARSYFFSRNDSLIVTVVRIGVFSYGICSWKDIITMLWDAFFPFPLLACYYVLLLNFFFSVTCECHSRLAANFCDLLPASKWRQEGIHFDLDDRNVLVFLTIWCRELKKHTIYFKYRDICMYVLKQMGGNVNLH